MYVWYGKIFWVSICLQYRQSVMQSMCADGQRGRQMNGQTQTDMCTDTDRHVGRQTNRKTGRNDDKTVMFNIVVSYIESSAAKTMACLPDSSQCDFWAWLWTGKWIVCFEGAGMVGSSDSSLSTWVTVNSSKNSCNVLTCQTWPNEYVNKWTNKVMTLWKCL